MLWWLESKCVRMRDAVRLVPAFAVSHVATTAFTFAYVPAAYQVTAHKHDITLQLDGGIEGPYQSS